MDSIWKTGKMQYSQLRHCDGEKWLWHCKLVSKHHKSCFPSLLQISILIRGGRGRKKSEKLPPGREFPIGRKKTHFSIRYDILSLPFQLFDGFLEREDLAKSSTMYFNPVCRGRTFFFSFDPISSGHQQPYHF